MGKMGGRLFCLLGLTGGLLQACGGDVGGGPVGRSQGSGGLGATGGSGSGGGPATGGKTTGSGGLSSGGFTATGGGKSTGGSIGTGGTIGTWGKVGTGGTTGSGGKGSGGTKATGGTASTGGRAGAECFPTTADNDCSRCVMSKCCQEWFDCGEDPHCSQKPAKEGELLCIQSCLIDAVVEGGAVDLQDCAAACQEQNSGVSEATSAIVACIRTTEDSGLQACSTVCFGTELP